MKCILSRKSLLLSVGLLAFAAPQAAKSASVQFESPTDLLSFDHRTAADAASLNFIHSATGGTNGSGGVVHTATLPEDTTAIYTPQSFDLTTGVMHTVTVDFLTGTVPIGGSANAMSMIGFSGNNNTGFYSNAADSFIGGRVRHQSGALNGLQSQTKIAGGGAISAPANGSVANIAFLSNNWYRISLSVTRDANVTNQFAYSLTLTDIGPTGTSTPTAVTNGTLAGNFSNADLYADTTAYAAFRGVPSVTNGNIAFDNFNAFAAPEPAGAMLLGLSALTFLVRRRPA